MTRTLKMITAATLLLLAAALAWSQPRSGQGGQGMQGGRMGGGMGLSAEQLLGLRSSLRDVYQDQLEMRQDMRSGDVDFQQMREEMTALRAELMTRINGVLDEDQQKKLQARLEEMQTQGGRERRPGGRN